MSDISQRIAGLEDEQLRDHLVAAAQARGEDSPIVRRALELAEEVAKASTRERASTGAPIAEALRQALDRLGPDDAHRVKIRVFRPGLVVARPERLLLLSELALRLMLLRSPSGQVDASIVEEGSWLWLRARNPQVVRGWPPTPTGRAFIALLEALTAKIDGELHVEGGLVEVRLPRPAS